MKNMLLPIGTVILFESRELMICSYIKKDAIVNGDHYDYACCLYPQGVSNDAILIKKEQIEKILFIGYQGATFEQFKVDLEG